MHLNLNVRGLQPSATLAINERSLALRQEGREVFRLGLGQSPFPVPGPVVAELKANASQKDYLPVRGLRALREAVAEYFHRRQGLAGSEKDVLVGPGSKELLFLLQLTYYGDLEIPAPAWVSYAPQAQIIGRPIHWIQTEAKNQWRIQPEALDAAWSADPDRPRLLILNYPGNPTGTTYSAAELQALAEVCRRYRVTVLSDEIYGEIHHQGAHVSLARYYPEGTIVSSGLSKWCGAGGWRLGVFLFPRALSRLADAMAAVASETYTSTSAPIQYAAVRAFKVDGEMEHYLAQTRRILHALGNLLADNLRQMGAQVATPQGGFYLFPDFSPLKSPLAARGIHTSKMLAEALLEATGVATLPGSEFGRPPEELTLRLAYVDFDGGRALTAAEATATLDPTFFELHTPALTKAIQKMGEWLPKAPISCLR